MSDPTDLDDYSHRGVVVCNPVAGDEDHEAEVRGLADEFGFDVAVTDHEGHGLDLAREAVESGATLVLACGGDGTINEVVRGVDQAGGLGEVALAVLPAGTGNNFASNVGVESIRDGFEVATDGERRRVDLGEVVLPDGERRPFVNSCVAGLTAESSAATDPDDKRRFGVVAYALETLRALEAFESLHLEFTTADGEDHEVDASLLLAGNGRGFPAKGETQADMEDGELDVTVVEGDPRVDLVGDAAVARLLGKAGDSVSRFHTTELHLRVVDDEHTTFSLDGEMVEATALTIRIRPAAMSLCVGEGYEPHPT